jgi:hypothetical protein
MKRSSMLVCLLALAQCAIAGDFDLVSHAKDLVVTIRPHAEILIFGDPLFVEITVVNRGTESLRAPAPGLLEFIATERESGLQFACPGGGWPPGLGEIPIVSYAPNQAMKVIQGIGLPGNIKYVPKTIDDLGHPFWRRLVGGGELGFRCIFHFPVGSGLEVVSNDALISIKPRPQKEIAALQEFAEYDKSIGATILPRNFGFIGLDGLRTRAQTGLLAARIKSGELAGILTLTRLMEKLKNDDIDREAVSQEVLDWIAAQPNIKRQWMAQTASHPTYQQILSPSVLEKLRAIAAEPVAPAAN